MSSNNPTTHPLQFIAAQVRAARERPTVAVTPQIDSLLAADCVVAIGVSGGKDSQACAIAVIRHLDEMGHTGPRVLVHADLGEVEWKDSLPCCERLAAHLGLELMVVRRKAGDMLARWEGRWANNVARYNALETVRLILPWSTPSMRFCTSELKAAVISSALKRRFPAHDIINVSGIRREESSARSRMPVSCVDSRLQRRGRAGVTWNAIIEWSIGEVLDCIAGAGLELHEAYTRYNMTRVSCAFCIMSSLSDLENSALCEDNQDVYRKMVDLEARSTFAFQGNRWLADIAPHLLHEDLAARVAWAKAAAAKRIAIEAEVPAHLLYKSGWPDRLPTLEEAELLASVRRRISSLLGLNSMHLSADDVMTKYAALLAAKPAAAPGAVQEPMQLSLV